MLRTILRLAADLGTIRCEELARALNTSPELVRLALAELARRDYLQAVAPDCSTACEHCPLRAAFLYRRQPRVWVITRKGAAAMGDRRIHFGLTHVSDRGQF
jgi:predicted ArsR family transcriptional regulator